MAHIKYSAEELAFIQSRCELTRRQLTQKFNDTFDRSVSVQNITGLCKRNGWLTGRSGKFEKGCASWNKGKKGCTSANSASFKKGHRPHNTTYKGCERVTTEGYVKVKIGEPNIWKFKSRLVWEKANGKIQKNHVIIYKDGDALNCELDNLIMVSRYELSVLNKLGYKNAAGEIKPTMLALAKLKEMVKRKGENNAH